MMETEVARTDAPDLFEAAVYRAATLLENGEVVALPTETVYGLAADALQPAAVLKIFEAKERPFFDPLIVHLPAIEWLERVAQIPAESRALIQMLVDKFWPGPLTLVVPRREIIPDIITAGLPTVAVRMSANPLFRAVATRLNKPLAAPSANRFGRISPTTAEHVLAELEGRIPLVVDGGATPHGIESTIIRIDGADMRLLRSGPVAPDALAEVWKTSCDERAETPGEAQVAAFFERLGVSFGEMLRGEENVAVEAPGQLASHYAPRTPLRLLTRGEHFRLEDERVGSLAFTTPCSAGKFAAEEILSPSGDLREAAATLFAKLRRLDEAGLDVIFAEPVPEHGLGIAIMDRLRRAAHG